MEGRPNKRLKTDFTGSDDINLLSDGKLQTEDGFVFPIQKFGLTKMNKYFRALFCRMEKDRNDFLIPGIENEILSNILECIYSRNINITNENIGELMIASDYLMEDGSLTKIQEFLKNNLSPDNCLIVLEAALKINREDFVKQSY